MTNEAIENDFNTAFGEAAGDVHTPSPVEPTQEPDTSADGGVNDGDVVEPTQDGEVESTTPDAGTGAADGAGGTAAGGESDLEAPEVPESESPEAKGTATPVTPEPQPQPAIDPKYLAAALAEYHNSLNKPEPTAPKEPEGPKEFKPEDFLDDAQKAALENFETEWSEVKGPVTALIHAHVQAALANQEQKLLSQVYQSLAPIQQVTAQSQEAMHYATIQAAHPDFREKVQEVGAWIEQQPALVRPAYERVFQQGTAAEVVELFDAYKKATGMTGAAPAQPASSAAQVPPQKAVPKAALAATLAPPTAQRSTPVNSRDPNDFEGAFEEATSGR